MTRFTRFLDPFSNINSIKNRGSRRAQAPNVTGDLEWRFANRARSAMWHSSTNQLCAVGAHCQSPYQVTESLTFFLCDQDTRLLFSDFHRILEDVKMGVSTANIFSSLDISIIIGSKEIKSLSKQPKLYFPLNPSYLSVRTSLSSL
jgi:hypothetical protein